MRRPLPRTYPELEIRRNWPLYIEYRVNNWGLAKDGSGRVRRGFGWSFWDVIVIAALVYLVVYPPVSVFVFINNFTRTYPLVLGPFRRGNPSEPNLYSK
jgi:hypothetical protein